jgi:uncharacterized protein
MPTPTPTLLRECHRLRKHLRDLKDEIDRGPRVLKIQQQKLANEEQAHKDHFDTIKKLKLKQKDDEGSLKTIEQQLDKLGTKSMTVTTMKEMDAVKHETEQATAKKNALEDAVLTSMTEIEERTANIPNIEKKWKEAQQEFAQYQADAKERLERLVEDQKISEEQLAKHESEIPANVRDQYDRLVKNYGPEGLAGVRGQVCQQCRSGIGESRVIAIENGQFITCSVCCRGLYLAAGE